MNEELLGLGLLMLIYASPFLLFYLRGLSDSA